MVEKKPNWEKIFAALDAAGVPDGFMDDREQGPPQKHKGLESLLAEEFEAE